MTRLLEEKKSTWNLLAIFAIATFGLHVLTLFFLIFQGFVIRQYSTRKPPTFVQLTDGKGTLVNDNLEREPEEIRQFVAKTMGAIFDWSGTLPPQTVEQATNPQADSGIAIKTPQGLIRKVPTASWVGSFALAEDFRQGFLAQIADITPPEVFSNKSTNLSSNNSSQVITARLVVQRVYPPQKIALGKWRVGMVANIVQIRRSDNRKILTPFNKDFLVRAVDTFPHPLAKEITELQKAVYSVRAQKMEIYEIHDLCLTDGYDTNPGNKLNRCRDNLNTGSFVR
jgi:hypothetical protein